MPVLDHRSPSEKSPVPLRRPATVINRHGASSFDQDQRRASQGEMPKMTVTSHRKIRIEELTGGKLERFWLVVLSSWYRWAAMRIRAACPDGRYLFAERIAELIAERSSSRGTTTLAAPVVLLAAPIISVTCREELPSPQQHLKCSGVRFCVPPASRSYPADRHQRTRWQGADYPRSCARIYRTRKALIPSFYLWGIADSLRPSIVGAEKAKKTVATAPMPLPVSRCIFARNGFAMDLIRGPLSPRKVMDMPVSGVPTVKFEEAEIAVPVEFDELASEGYRAAIRGFVPPRPR